MTKFTKILAAVALLWLVAAQATPLMAQQYDYDFQVGQLYYKITDATKRKVAVVRGNNEPTGAISIPATVVNGGNTYSVTSIGERAFSSCSGLTAITIPNGVTSIGRGAFEDCKGLTSINIPSSVTIIENRTFYSCTNLASITLENGVDSIGSKFFKYYNSDKGVFEGCTRLTSINIPSSVKFIGTNSFSGCSGLTSINIPNDITKIEDGTFSGCKGLTSINIPNSVTSIGERAFYQCSGLTSITIPNGVTSIGGGAFYDCSGLRYVTLPGHIYFKDKFGTTSNIDTVIISDGSTTICNSSFSECSKIKSVCIPNSVTSIGTNSFSGCSELTSINIPNGVTSIGRGAFEDCSGLTSINIPNGVTSIEEWTFYGCSELTSITIPNGVTSIGKWAFKYCNRLTSINIPSGVTSIGEGAFKNCMRLDSVSVHWQTPLKVPYIFDGMTFSRTRLIVPFGRRNVYQSASVWKDFYSIVERKPMNYIVTYTQSVGGTLTVKDGWQEVSSGSKVQEDTKLTIETTTAEGYKLDSIRVNGYRIEGLSFTVKGNSTVEAFFGKVGYMVTYTQSVGGTLTVKNGTQTVSSGNSVEYGTELTVKTAPDAGFKLKSLTLNGQTIPDNYKFAISEPVTIEVVFTSVGTGLDETSAAGTVVYPNPVVDILRIATDTPIRTIRVFDIYGKEVARAADTDRIDLSHLPAGVYTVRADGKTAKVVKK